MKKFDVIVVGAGINGLATAYHLSNRKDLKIGLIEQFSTGHMRGSSHGFSRIFRSTYVNPIYTKLARHADLHDWPDLEERLNCKFLYPNSRCLFGYGLTFEKYIENILKSHSEHEIGVLEASIARQYFPQFNFPNVGKVLHDHTSKVIAANAVMNSLWSEVIKRRIEVFSNTQVTSFQSDSSSIRLETTKGQIHCERLVIAAGPWIKKLIPGLEKQFSPIKQIVGYFKLSGAPEQYQVGRFPNWVCFGEGKNNDFYGLPEFGCEGVKVAQEYMEDEDDPDKEKDEIDKEKIKNLEVFVKKHFVGHIESKKIETCFYTNTSSNDFVMDFYPHDNRIVICSACSGHAFKFAPLTGKIVSELVLEGKTTIDTFEEASFRFQ
jgi:sarcosine oxidase